MGVDPATLDMVHDALLKELEGDIQQYGQRLLESVAQVQTEQSRGNLWLNQMIRHLMGNESLRVRALRFVDVVPALDDDRDLTDHLRQYFSTDELMIPKFARWGLDHTNNWLGSKMAARVVRLGMRIVARRYMGGDQPRNVLQHAKRLRGQGFNLSLDHLGEATLSEAEADCYLQSNLSLIKQMQTDLARWPTNELLDWAHGRESPRLNLSIKPSSLYSQIKSQDPDGSVVGMASRLRPLLRTARSLGAAVCIDMEHYDYKEIILRLFKDVMMEDEFRDWPDVGIAIQSYLKESTGDLLELIAWVKERGTPVTVRLVRGAYWDQESVLSAQMGWAMPVWEHKWQTDAAYERNLALLFANYPLIEVAIASHNLRSIAATMALAHYYRLAPSQYEFQMLYGMSDQLQRVVKGEGQRLRVYVPFGQVIPGMAYLVRRLLENASSQAFLTNAFFEEVDPQALLSPPLPSEKKLSESSAQPNVKEPFHNEPIRRLTSSSERKDISDALSNVRAQLGGEHALWIDGENIFTDQFIVSRNPSHTDEVIGTVAQADVTHADRAVDAAQRALNDWGRRPQAERSHLLMKVADLLRQRRDEFSAWEVLEAGKSWREADADITEAIDFLDYYSRQALEMATSPWQVDYPGESNRYEYRPRGVGVIIPPWNFPLAILAGMLSGAVVTGNTVILKPSSETPVVAARFMALLHEAGLPANVVQFLPGTGDVIGEYMVSHPSVHFIAFTGSQAVGLRINELAAEQREGQSHVKHVIAEMGGKNALVIDHDAHLDDAIVATLTSAFGYQGQKCSAASRVVVVGSHYQQYLERLVEAAKSLSIGPAEEFAHFMGPVISGQARIRISDRITEAKAGTSALLEGDCSHLNHGHFVGPTIFSDVSPEHPLAQHEVFGPVLAVMRADTFQQALEIANGTQYALTGGVFSRSPANLELARNRFEVGNLYLNRHITGALVGRQPFGGFRLSGIGLKAGGPDYLRQFVISRTVTSNMLRRGFAPAADMSEELWRF